MFTNTTTSTSSSTTTTTTSATAHTRTPAKHIIRSSRACDQCRKLRIRCVRPSGSDSCQNCSKRRFDCTAEGPEHKRGPPRGYLHQLENRLHGAEALLGILISLSSLSPTNSSHPITLNETLTTLARIDPQASEILNRVNNSAFGPSGRNLREWLIDAVKNSGEGCELRKGTRLGLANDSADLMMTQKTNRWQDQLIHQLSPSSPSSSTSSLHHHQPLPSPLFSFDHSASISSPTSSEWPLPANLDLFSDMDSGSPLPENIPSPDSFYSSCGSDSAFPSSNLFGVEL